MNMWDQLHNMTEDDDPRQHGFNYGRGWGDDPKPAIYYEAEAVASRLRQAANEASAEAWSLDMVIRNIRLAGTPEEKVKAVFALEQRMRRYRRLIAAE